MNALAEQIPLQITRTPAKVSMPLEIVWQKKSQGAAFTLACDVSGLDDKEIYLALAIDAGTFSRMKKGTNTLPGDQLKDFCQIVGNTIYADWLAYQLGCGLVMLKSEAERIAEAAVARAEKAEEQVAMLKGLLVGRAV